ncbi:MAG: hypothetical protein GY854_11150, partial [Deltaproteobacteria bacterium]|nr:hypothetical protein [Deltaproteobacteria bacterium]
MTEAKQRQLMRRLAPWLLAAVSGISFALALPALCWWPLLLLFPGLLLESLRRVDRGWRALLLGWWGGGVCWFISTSWVYPVMHDYGGLPVAAAAVCQLLMAVYLGFSWALVSWWTCLVSPRLRIWLLPLAWSAVEAWRQMLFYIFPWNPTASALAPSPAALLSLPVWGATGLAWAVTAIGCGLYSVCRRDTRR